MFDLFETYCKNELVTSYKAFVNVFYNIIIIIYFLPFLLLVYPKWPILLFQSWRRSGAYVLWPSFRSPWPRSCCQYHPDQHQSLCSSLLTVYQPYSVLCLGVFPIVLGHSATFLPGLVLGLLTVVVAFVVAFAAPFVAVAYDALKPSLQYFGDVQYSLSKRFL